MTTPTAEKQLAPAGGMYRRIARNAAMFGSGTAASALFTMLAVAIAARALSARDFGVLVLLQSAVLMLRALTTFSTQQPVIKLGSDAQAEGDRERLGAIVSMGLVVDLVASAFAFAIAAFCIELSRGAIGLADQDVGSAWILAFSLLFTGYLTSNGIFRLYDRFGALSLVQTLSAACLFVAYGALFLMGARLQAFVSAWAIYLSTSSLWQLWVSLRLVHEDGVQVRPTLRRFATADGRTLLHYCWSTWGTSTAETVRTNGDSLLIGAIVSVEAAGIYNAARQLAGVLRKFNVVYMSTVFPEVARLASRNDTRGALRLKRRMFWAGAALAVVAVGLAAIFGHLVLKLLFGPRFVPAYLPFIFLTAAAVAQLVSMTPSMSVQVFRGPRLLLALYVGATLVFLAAAVGLTFSLSITGMAIAQLIFPLILGLACNVALRRVLVGTTSVDEAKRPI